MFIDYYLKFDSWFAQEELKEWLEWKNYCEKWCEYRSKNQSYDELMVEIKSLKNFFIFHLNGRIKLNSLNKFIEECNKRYDNITILKNNLKNNYINKQKVMNDLYVVANFIDYTLYSSKDNILNDFKNPYLYVFCEQHARIYDAVSILKIDNKWDDWVGYINKWIEINNIDPKIYFKIFIIFLKENDRYSNLDFFFSKENNNFKSNLLKFLKMFLKEKRLCCIKPLKVKFS